MNETADIVEFRGGRRTATIAAASCGVGVLALIVGAFVDPRRALLGYLTAFNYVVTIAVGALLFLMICHAMHAGWPTLLRRLTEGIVATIPLFVVLFVPILVGLHIIYPWLRPATIADERARHLVSLKTAYLNLGGFIGRTAFYFAIWIFVAFWLQRWSRAMDKSPSPEASDRMFAMSGLLMPLVGLALSFAAFDWVMSLTPTWASTMYPVVYFAGGFLGALALLTVMTWAADRAGLIAGINSSHYYALGRLLLAFVIFWAYVQFFQFMLMWIADKPDEVTFYLARVKGGFLVETVVLVLVQFVVPFFVLLNYPLKRNRDQLAAVAAWLVVAHYLDVHWLVMPSGLPVGAHPFSFMDFAALLAVGGAAVLFGVFRLRGVRMVPAHDPALPDALRYESA
jgi:hypothetical protein